MMIELKNFIQDNYNQDMQVILTNIIDLFEDLEVPNAQENYVAMMMDENNIEDIALAIYQQIYNDSKEILKMFGIQVQDDTLLSQIGELIEAFTVLESYEDSVNVVAYLLGESTNVDRVCNLLSLVTPYPIEHWLTVLSEVSNTLIKTLLDLHSEKANNSQVDGEEELDTESKQKIVDRLKEFYKDEELKNCIGFQLITQGVVVGSTFITYVDKVRSYLEMLPNNTLVNELFILLVMSRDGFLNPMTTYQTYSGKIFDDIAKITTINTALIAKFSKFN